MNKEIDNKIIIDKLNSKTCFICLEEQTEHDIENCIEHDNKLIEYNHCGNYYVHNKCLNNWKFNECLICRKNLNENIISNNYESDNDIITILIDDDNNLLYKRYWFNFCIFINLFGIIIYFVLKKK